MHGVVLAAACHDVPVRTQHHRYQGAHPLQLLPKLPGGRLEERHPTVTGRRQLPCAGPGDRADGAGMIVGSPSFSTVRTIRPNLPGAGGRQPLAVLRPRHVFHPTAADVDHLLCLTFGDAPDEDSSVLAGRGERGPVWVDRHREHPAVVHAALRPEGRARPAVERIDATRGVTDHQRLTEEGPAPGDGVVADGRRPARAKNAAPAVDIQIRHASNPCRMLCSSRLRPMKTS